MKIFIKRIRIQTVLMASYFIATPIYSIINKMLGENVATVLVNTIIGALLLFAIFQCNKKRLMYPVIIYICIMLFVMITFLVHPEYSDWYTHDMYGISRTFFDMRSGITALFIFSIYENEDDLVKDIKLSAILVFIAYSYKYLQALGRGYFIINTVEGTQKKALYDMELGYRILFPAAIFGADGFLNNRIKSIIFYAICTMIILLGGSRAPFLWAICVIPVSLVFRYRGFSRRKKNIFWGVLVIVAIVFISTIINKEELLRIFSNMVSSLGIQSRTMDSLVSGSFSSANGRDKIYQIAVDLIKSGGPMGYGFYGDRPHIGPRFRWGYCHNIALEILVQFGYILGVMLLLILIYNIVKFFIRCNSKNSQIIFVTIFISTLRLLVSNSFWYEPWFWALIAMFGMFNIRGRDKIILRMGINQ